MDTDLLLAVLQALEDEGVEYVLVGGAAMNVLGLVRATEDADIFLRPTASNIEALKRALRSVFDDPSIAEISEEDLIGDYPAVRYFPPKGDLYLDLLTRLGSTFQYTDLEFDEVVRDSVPIRVATPKTLFNMKIDTVRAIDRQDAERLRVAFDLGEGDEDAG